MVDSLANSLPADPQYVMQDHEDIAVKMPHAVCVMS